jgi:hypothetical protein
MSPIKAELLKTLETAPNSAIEQTLHYLQSLLSDRTDLTSDFQPKTAMGKKLWEIRQQAIANGMTLLTEAELEQELIDRRGGYRDLQN